jgi:hypothetical protein
MIRINIGGGSVRGIIDLSYQFFEIFLIFILIGLVYLILSMFIKKRIIIMFVIAILTIGSILFIEQTKYTTLMELYTNQINENSAIKSVTITVFDKQKKIPDFNSSVTIEDEIVINRIIDDLASVKLKKDKDTPTLHGEYHINIAVSNEIEEDHFSLTSVGFDISSKYVNNYAIISDTDHLKTIESLVKDH